MFSYITDVKDIHRAKHHIYSDAKPQRHSNEKSVWAMTEGFDDCKKGSLDHVRLVSFFSS